MKLGKEALRLAGAILLCTALLSTGMTACSGDKGEGEAVLKESGSSGQAGQQSEPPPQSPPPAPTQTTPPPQEQEKQLKIGFVGPLTGEGSSYGLRVLAGMTLALKHINDKGGIGNRKIELIKSDNKDDPALTSSIIEDFIAQEVVAILAAPTGWSTFAPTHRVNQSHTIFFSVGSMRRIARSGPFVFRIALPDEIAAADIIDVSAESGHANYALITASLIEYSLDLSSSFKKAMLKKGSRIVVEGDTYDTYTGKSDVDKVVKIIRSAPEKVDAIIYTGNGGEGARLAKAARAAGVKAPLIGGEILFDEDFLKNGGKAVVGTLLFSTYSPQAKSQKLLKFIDGYKKQTGKEPERFAALAYDGFLVIAEAIKRAGTTRPSKVRAELLGKKGFDGVTGHTAFNPRGEPIKHPFLYKIETTATGVGPILIQR